VFFPDSNHGPGLLPGTVLRLGRQTSPPRVCLSRKSMVHPSLSYLGDALMLSCHSVAVADFVSPPTLSKRETETERVSQAKKNSAAVQSACSGGETGLKVVSELQVNWQRVVKSLRT